MEHKNEYKMLKYVLSSKDGLNKLVKKCKEIEEMN